MCTLLVLALLSGPPLMPPPILPIIEDTFTGGTGYDADIDGRVPDGGGVSWRTRGTWEIHPNFTPPNRAIDAIDIVGSAAVSRGLNFKGYRLGTIHGAVEADVIYPSGSSTGLCNPGPIESNPPPGYVNSGSNPDTGEPWHRPNTEDSWTIWFLRPTANGQIITAETTAHYASFFNTNFQQQIPAGDHYIKWFYERSGGVSRIYFTSIVSASNPDSASNVTHQLLGTAGSTFTETAGCNFLGFSVYSDSGGTYFQAHANNSRIGGLFNHYTGMDTPTYTASGVTVSGSFPTVPTPDNITSLSLHVRTNLTTTENYNARIDFFHIGAIRKFQISLNARDSGFGNKVLKSNTVAGAPVLPGAFDVSYTWRLDLTSANILILSLDGVEQLRFDLIHDTVESSPHGSAPLYTGGTPMLGTAGTTSTEMRITRFTVYCVQGDTPPPPHPPPPVPAFMAVMKNGGWREVPTPSPDTDAVQVYARGAPRPARAGWIMIHGVWQPLSSGLNTPVVDPDDTPAFDPGCNPIITPLPPPQPLGTIALGLYNFTLPLLDQFPPFNGAITGANSQAGLSTLLAAIAARDMQCWFVPAYRKQQTTDSSNRGPYDHTATMAKFALFSGFTDANLSRIPFAIPYDEPDCDICWGGSPPTEAEVKAGCAAVTSYLGVPCAVRMSPRKMLALGWTPGAGDIRIGMAQYGGRAGYGAEGFGDNYAGYIAAQISAATTLGLDGILWGLNPFRTLSGGWLASWTDAYLANKLTLAAGAGMNYGVYMYAGGPPPSAHLLWPDTNQVLQDAAALL